MSTLTHINPEGLHNSPAFSQGVVVGAGKTIYVGGQNGVRSDGTLAGGDLAAQTKQALLNLIAVLAAAGASQVDVAKLTIYVVKGHDIQEGFAAAQQVWGDAPTAITVVIVDGLAVPGAVVEIEAIAAVAA